MPIRYFILDPADYSGTNNDTLSGTVGVVGSVSDAVFSNVRVAAGGAYIDPGVTRITWSDGSQVRIESLSWLSDSGGSSVVDPVFDGAVDPRALDTVFFLKLENGSIILLELTFGNPTQVDLDGETPDAFQFATSVFVTSPHSLTFGSPTLEQAFEGSFGSAPVCFAAGTLIAGPGGTVPVEALRPGDPVLTADGTVLPVLWAGGRRVSGAALAAHPKWAPIRIGPGALGPGVPARRLIVSPQHRILLDGPGIAQRFGQAVVFVPARGLLGLPGVDTLAAPEGIAYHHLLLPRHAVLLAEGAPAESLLPSDRSLASLPPAQRAAVREVIARHGLSPELAHPCLTVGAARRGLAPGDPAPLVLPSRHDCAAGAAS